MAVFKAYMRIAKKNMWMILMYLCIFLGVTVMFHASSSGLRSCSSILREMRLHSIRHRAFRWGL